MAKIDYKKELKELYNPSAKSISEVIVPKMNFIMIDGKGDPSKSEFGEAVGSLYPVAYGIKFAIKKGQGIDFGVMPLEGLWWADDMADFEKGNRDNWRWTAMIMQPEIVTEELVAKVIEEVKAKKKLTKIDLISFGPFEEGKSVQILNIGPFADEGPNIIKLHARIAEKGGKTCGKHHEIYLSNPSRTAPEKLKTILRQPLI